MTDKQFRSGWYLAISAVAGVVVAVATLLLVIIATARSILGHAVRAIDVANAIVTNTKPIWALEQTNVVAAQLLEGGAAIRQHATELADLLEPAEPAA